jgi:hypothetical protein
MRRLEQRVIALEARRVTKRSATSFTDSELIAVVSFATGYAATDEEPQ